MMMEQEQSVKVSSHRPMRLSLAFTAKRMSIIMTRQGTLSRGGGIIEAKGV